GLVDGAQVIVDLGLASLGSFGRKHAAAADAGDLDPVVADDAGGFIEADGFDLVPPGRNCCNTSTPAAFDGFGEAPDLAGGGEIQRDSTLGHGVSTLLTSSTAFMRFTARSGSLKTRALSARRKSSLRCWTERVDCWPPTIWKWSCSPLR